MILIADSGSTKTDWCVVEKGKLIQQISTKGTNPFFQSEEEISNEIATALLPQLTTNAFDAVYFYGAGCGFPDKIAMVHRAIIQHLQVSGDEVEVNTDMLAAARGLCGHEPGIACIMGTGSNSCYYDGKHIGANVSPLGFILGDEGSGACLGKLLVGDILKNQMTPELKEKFLKQFNLEPADIIDRVYRKPFPNRFLASLSPFLAQNLDEPCVRTLVLMNLANKNGGMVVGTGDLSELALGWATYNGDHMSMYGVNGSIPKTLVRYLVAYEADRTLGELSDVLQDVLDTPVSPELLPPKDGEISQKTEDLVGPYELHDFFLYYMLRFGYPPRKIFRAAHKTFAGVYDDATIKKWLTTFMRRFFTQQFKRSCLPDGPKVGTVTLSPRGDWRMPSDAVSALWLKEAESL